MPFKNPEDKKKADQRFHISRRKERLFSMKKRYQKKGRIKKGEGRIKLKVEKKEVETRPGYRRSPNAEDYDIPQQVKDSSSEGALDKKPCSPIGKSLRELGLEAEVELGGIERASQALNNVFDKGGTIDAGKENEKKV